MSLTPSCPLLRIQREAPSSSLTRSERGGCKAQPYISAEQHAREDKGVGHRFQINSKFTRAPDGYGSGGGLARWL